MLLPAPVIPRLNRAHPLAKRGLCALWCFAPRAGVQRDLVGTSHLTPNGISGASIVSTPLGRMPHSTHDVGAGDQYWSTAHAPGIAAPTTAITIVWVGQLLADADGWSALVCKACTTSDPWVSYSLQDNGGEPAPIDLIFVLSTGSGSSNTRTSTVPWLPTSTPLLAVCRWGGALGTTMRLDVWRLDTGASAGSGTNTFTGPIGYNTGAGTGDLFVGKNEGSSAFDADYGLCAIFSHCLNDHDVSILRADPFGLARPISRRRVAKIQTAAASTGTRWYRSKLIVPIF